MSITALPRLLRPFRWMALVLSLAMAVMSELSANDLRVVLAHQDKTRFAKISGVGKKTAERLVVELKEKLAVLARAAGPAARPGGGVLEQLEQALVNLGYKAAQAQQAAEALRGEVEGKRLDELLREALKRLRG